MQALLLAFGCFVLLMPMPRLIVLSPAETTSRCIIEMHFRLGVLYVNLKRVVNAEQLIIYFKRGVMGEAAIQMRYKAEGKETVYPYSVTFVNDQEDVEELAYCMASATQFPNLAKMHAGAETRFVLSGENSPDDIAIPPKQRGLPRLSVECAKSDTEYAYFDPARM